MIKTARKLHFVLYEKLLQIKNKGFTRIFFEFYGAKEIAAFYKPLGSRSGVFKTKEKILVLLVSKLISFWCFGEF